uniref:Uncharacterized protein n=1 Tax=Anguilla anguilla TaxID=7936 RepID=A0A0E9PL80_ANGAN
MSGNSLYFIANVIHNIYLYSWPVGHRWTNTG